MNNLPFKFAIYYKKEAKLIFKKVYLLFVFNADICVFDNNSGVSPLSIEEICNFYSFISTSVLILFSRNFLYHLLTVS